MATTERRRAAAALLGALGCAALFPDCGYDRADRWDDEARQALSACTPGEVRCTARLEVCSRTLAGEVWTPLDDCAARGLVCAPTLLRCTACKPDARSCDGLKVKVCLSDGSGEVVDDQCDAAAGFACRGGSCANLCQRAAKHKSNVGCEYWGADLDNAMIDPTLSAAGQQFAIVVSNPQPDIAARVTIDQMGRTPRGSAEVETVALADIPPLDLRVFRLGPREVDGSPDGELDTGTGTAITAHGFRVLSNVPVVAYQFNPLDNVAVFSNDASLLKPVEALTYTPGVLEPVYVVVGWPQTIAHTDNPDTNFDPSDPIDLRAFVTIVGTRPNTHVQMVTTTRVIPGSGIPDTPSGGTVEATLQPFDVLNLESGGFNADFTGSLIRADQPIVVFSGSEASDAPFFDKLSNRFCCADHLEEQLDPIRTAGKSFIAAHAPSRTRAVRDAGADMGVMDEPEYFRVVAVDADGPTLVSTTLPPPNDVFKLVGRGAFRDLTALRDFTIYADRPVLLGDVQPSQDASGVRRGLPGGDPSLIIVPPMEQARADYVFLTPDKYMFDFIAIAAPIDATVLLDGHPLDAYACPSAPADGLTPEERGKPKPAHVVYRCQLSFPVVYQDRPAPKNVDPGVQNDGVHRVQADLPVMVLVYGFDNYVSYGYAAGTQLETLSVR
jgi:hypothetical protein